MYKFAVLAPLVLAALVSCNSLQTDDISLEPTNIQRCTYQGKIEVVKRTVFTSSYFPVARLGVRCDWTTSPNNVVEFKFSVQKLQSGKWVDVTCYDVNACGNDYTQVLYPKASGPLEGYRRVLGVASKNCDDLVGTYRGRVFVGWRTKYSNFVGTTYYYSPQAYVPRCPF